MQQQARAKVVVLLPPGPNTSMTEFRPVAFAAEAARYVRETSRPEKLCDVFVAPDAEVGVEALEVLGAEQASVEIPVSCPLQFLTLQIKDVGRFCGVEVVIEDDKGEAKHLLISNRHTAVRVSKADEKKGTPAACSMPLVLTLGWNKITIDLADAVSRAFSGSTYVRTRNVVLHPSMRIARVYFEARPFEDTELPAWLRTVT